MVSRLVLALIAALSLAGPAWAQSATRSPELLMMPVYTVLGVPGGAIAMDFATATRPAFEARPAVGAAFLCWVSYGDDPQPALALLIVGPRDAGLMQAVGAEFSRLSGPQDSLDIIFIKQAEAAEIGVPAMYVRTADNR